VENGATVGKVIQKQASVDDITNRDLPESKPARTVSGRYPYEPHPSIVSRHRRIDL
jgi:hypothetical protein